MYRKETVEKACHCEPVRAAKQVPLGYTLARQSVSKTYKSCAFRRFLAEKITDFHTSDIGHWFGMTGAGFIDTLRKKTGFAGLFSYKYKNPPGDRWKTH